MRSKRFNFLQRKWRRDDNNLEGIKYVKLHAYKV